MAFHSRPPQHAVLGLLLSGDYQLFSQYGPWREPQHRSPLELHWDPKSTWPLAGVQMGRGVLDLRYYSITSAKLGEPRHVLIGSTASKALLELTLVHAWTNATAVAKATSEVLEAELKDKLKSANTAEQEALMARLVRLHSDVRTTSVQDQVWERVEVERQRKARQQFDELARERAGLRRQARVEEKLETKLGEEQARSRARYQDLRDALSQLKARLEGATEEEWVRMVANVTRASEAWRPCAPEPLGLGRLAEEARQCARSAQAVARLKEQRADDIHAAKAKVAKVEADLERVATEIKHAVHAQEDLDHINALMRREEGLNSKKAALQRELEKRLAHIDRRFQADKEKAKEKAARSREEGLSSLSRLVSTTESVLAEMNASETVGVSNRTLCSFLPIGEWCLGSSLGGTSRRLARLEEHMAKEAWELAVRSTQSTLEIVVPLEAGPEDTGPVPALLQAFRTEPDGSGPLWDLEAGWASAYAALPPFGGHSAPAARVVVRPLRLPRVWLNETWDWVRRHGVPSRREVPLHLGAAALQSVEVFSQPASRTELIKPNPNAVRDFRAFAVLAATTSVLCAASLYCVEAQKQEELCEMLTWFQRVVKIDLKGQLQSLKGDDKARFLVVSVVLLACHAALLAGLPLYAIGEARCLSGIPWACHMAYVGFQGLSRGTEVYFYSKMGGSGTGYGYALLKSALGCNAGLDFYTDAAFVLTTYLCRGPITLWGIQVWALALLLFVVSVCVMQIAVPLVFALMYPERRTYLLMGLNNFELLANYYNPYDENSTYSSIGPNDKPGSERSGQGYQKCKHLVALGLTLVRVCLEDGPQQLLQFSFKSSLPNTSMMLIWVSLASAVVSAVGGLALCIIDAVSTMNEQVFEEKRESQPAMLDAFLKSLNGAFTCVVDAIANAVHNGGVNGVFMGLFYGVSLSTALGPFGGIPKLLAFLGGFVGGFCLNVAWPDKLEFWGFGYNLGWFAVCCAVGSSYGGFLGIVAFIVLPPVPHLLMRLNSAPDQNPVMLHIIQHTYNHAVVFSVAGGVKGFVLGIACSTLGVICNASTAWPYDWAWQLARV